MAQERQFKGVWIPAEIWLDERLNMLEKGILTEIDSLDNENGCSAGNDYLADFCQCSETKVSTAIKKLIELGYIYLKSFDGRTRILKSRLSKNERQDLKILKADIKKVKANNIDNNKTNNIDNIKYIVEYLNEKANTNYKHSTSKTQILIKARLKDGFNVNDFKSVIDKKCKEWIGTEFEKYLRPETLFGNKFESYLNARETKKDMENERQLNKEELNGLFDDISNIKI